jgi:hypothetical protein
MTAQVVELIDVQTQLGQQVLNVYHYLDSSGALAITDLLDKYVSDVLPKVANFTEASLVHTTLRYRQVFPAATLMLERDITDVPGVAASTGIFSSETAFSFKFALPNATVNLVGGTLPHIRRGGCRIAGVPKGAVTGDVVASGTVTVAATWATSLISPAAGGWVLVVASFLNGARARQHTVQQYSQVGSISAPAVSTQNTRKILRGRVF